MEDTAPVEPPTPSTPDAEVSAAAEATPAEAPAPVETTASAALTEPPAEQAEGGLPPADAEEIAPDAAALAALAERSLSQRLPTAEEERAAKLVQVGLLANKDEQAAVIAALPKLGWSAAVKGVTAAWASMKTTTRNALVKGLSADEGEGARRIRLSIARGLFKVPDVATATKLVLGVCKEIRDKETGQIAPKDAQHFSHVMIGKGKPWIAQLALSEMKPSDVALLVHCAVIAAFSVGGPPVTPLGILKWAAEAGQLSELSPTALEIVTKSVARWSPKWADALRKEVPNAPEPILAALRPARADGEALAEEQRGASAEGEELPAELRSTAASAAEEDGSLPSALKEAPATSDADSQGTPAGEQAKQKERPVYVSKTVPAKDSRPPAPAAPQPQGQPTAPRERESKGASAKSPQFNATDVLRQLESHIGWLKGELQNAEKKLRVREDDRRQARRKPEVPVIEGEPTPEELARVNVQLEARITELQARIDDLTADAEARATSAGAFVEGPAPEPDTQLRTLLGLKLRDSYADFCALEQEDRDLVIPQHYRTVLAGVFEVLKVENVPLEQEGEKERSA